MTRRSPAANFHGRKAAPFRKGGKRRAQVVPKARTGKAKAQSSAGAGKRRSA